MTTIPFTFSNKEAARQFLLWLCEQGEQEYWEWMKHREGETEEPNITVVDFSYNFRDLSVKLTEGRLDDDGSD